MLPCEIAGLDDAKTTNCGEKNDTKAFYCGNQECRLWKNLIKVVLENVSASCVCYEIEK